MEPNNEDVVGPEELVENAVGDVIMLFDLTNLQDVKMDFSKMVTPEDYVMLNMSMLYTLMDKAIKKFTELGHKDAEARIKTASTTLLTKIIKDVQSSTLPMVRPLITNQ